ncbi:molybdenum cofactor biosynthesis protein [Boudabousia liubingyangii]|uniref:Molybdenum cofactor biosynthesis protein n=2 Tax=Boudabousia liubingyangii TaxID=1921764 RepID=A0A1Q5PQH4_9ACTO|nr:molybdenum cofactor biosynthesis protein [Boudabousia liubingyangii]
MKKVPEMTNEPIKEKGFHKLPEPVKGAVITVSDRCFNGKREDKSGPLAVSLLADFDVVCGDPVVIPDEVDQIQAAISKAVKDGARVVLTTGGTGVTPRDVTPEATAPLLAAELPGLAQQVVNYGLQKTPLAGLSRGLVGVTSKEADGAMVINAPGSSGGVRDTVTVLGPLVPHILEQLGGGDH